MIGKLSNTFIINPFYNIIRVVSYLLFYIGLILRFTDTTNDESFSAAKIILAYDLEIWFIRSLTFLGISQKMGPKLVMIRRMVPRNLPPFSFLSYSYLFLDHRSIFLHIHYSNCNDCVRRRFANNVYLQ